MVKYLVILLLALLVVSCLQKDLTTPTDTIYYIIPPDLRGSDWICWAPPEYPAGHCRKVDQIKQFLASRDAD